MEMDSVMVGRGYTWSPVPCRDWCPPGGVSRRFLAGEVQSPPSPEAWAWLTAAIATCCPLAVGAIGPVLTGGPPDKRRGERLPGLILVALAKNPNPLETAFHECAHELRDKLSLDEENALRLHAEEARPAAWVQGGDAAPFLADEGPAYVFGRWAAGQPDFVKMSPACLAVMQAMKCGDVATRKGAP